MKVKTHLKAGKPLGDNVADFTRATGIDRVVNWFSKVTGVDCGCDQRRRMLNRLSPWK